MLAFACTPHEGRAPGVRFASYGQAGRFAAKDTAHFVADWEENCVEYVREVRLLKGSFTPHVCGHADFTVQVTCDGAPCAFTSSETGILKDTSAIDVVLPDIEGPLAIDIVLTHSNGKESSRHHFDLVLARPVRYEAHCWGTTALETSGPNSCAALWLNDLEGEHRYTNVVFGSYDANGGFLRVEARSEFLVGGRAQPPRNPRYCNARQFGVAPSDPTSAQCFSVGEPGTLRLTHGATTLEMNFHPDGSFTSSLPIVR